jgi:hypothetical protein
MATVTATVGGATSNSYVTIAEADTYFAERLQVTNWTGANEDVQGRAVIAATRQLDREQFVGEKSDTAQALKWPRIAAYDEDGYEYASDAIPTPIKHATFELALRLLNQNADSADLLAGSGLESFKRVKVGPIEVEPRHAYDPSDLPDSVLDLIEHVVTTAAFSGELIRG